MTEKLVAKALHSIRRVIHDPRWFQHGELPNFTSGGSGAFGRVFYSMEDMDHVIKCFKPDRGYEVYLNEVVLKLQGNPHVPKASPIYQIDDHYSMVILETLRSSENNDDYDLVYDLEHALIGIDYSDQDSRRDDFLQQFPDMKYLLELCSLCLDIFPNDIGRDIHSGNVMFRGDIPVLTDPFYGKKTLNH